MTCCQKIIKKSNQYYVLHVVFYANYAYNSRTFPFLITQNCASTDLHVNSRQSMKGGHWCALYNHLLRKRVKSCLFKLYLCPKKGTLFLKCVCSVVRVIHSDQHILYVGSFNQTFVGGRESHGVDAESGMGDHDSWW